MAGEVNKFLIRISFNALLMNSISNGMRKSKSKLPKRLLAAKRLKRRVFGPHHGQIVYRKPQKMLVVSCFSSENSPFLSLGMNLSCIFPLQMA